MHIYRKEEITRADFTTYNFIKDFDLTIDLPV